MRRALVFAAIAILVVCSIVATSWPRNSGRPISAPAGSGSRVHAKSTSRPSPTVQPTKTQLAQPQVKRTIRKPMPFPYVVLFVLDGARPDYFNVSGIPHIQALVHGGTSYTNAWAGILESETPSGHASIATGSAPRQDGIPSFSWATNDNLSVNLFDPNVVRAGAMERVMAQSHAPTIAGLIHRADPSAKVVAMSGHKYYAADALGGPSADVIMYYNGTRDGKYAPTAIPGHVPPSNVLSNRSLIYHTTRLRLGVEDHLVMKLAMTTFQRMHQRVTLINVPEFDWPLGHVFGGDRDPSAVRTLMRGFDQDLGRVEDMYRRAGLLNRTIFAITADHGFAPIYRTVSDASIKKAVSAAGTSIISDTYHTGAFLWLRDESRAAAAASNIAHLRNPYIQSVYFKESIPGGYDYVRASSADLFDTPGTEAANQYLLRSFGGPSGPDVVVLFTEDTASLPGGQSSWKGDHGGAAWESQHIPLILSGPGVRPGFVSDYPARLMDIAPTVLGLMRVPHTGMTGIPLADSMQSPPAPVRASQQTQGAVLRPIVSSLKTESRQEVAAGR